MTAAARFVRSKTFQIGLGLLLAIAILWVSLPHLVTRYVNRQLAALENYTGSVREVRLNLWRGAYRVEGIELVSRLASGYPPFFRADAMDLQVPWGDLVRGLLVARIEMHRPVVNYVVAPDIEQVEPDRNWQEVLEDLAPFRIDRFAIHQGEVNYRNLTMRPNVHLHVRELEAVGRNLTNTADEPDDLFARFEGKGVAMGKAPLTFRGRANPLEEQPTFELRMGLQELALEDLGGFMQGYAGFQPSGGMLSMDAELNGAGGRVRGVLNAAIDDLRVADVRAPEGAVGRLWGAARDAVLPRLQQPESRDVSVRVPIDVSVDDPAAGIWSAASEALRTAFVRSLRRGLRDAFPLPG